MDLQVMDLQAELERVQAEIAQIRQESGEAEQVFQQRAQAHQQVQQTRYEALLRAQGVEAFLQGQLGDAE